MMAFDRQKKHIARVEHTCFLCGRPIEKGTEYIRHSGEDDGEFFDNCYHEECVDLIDTFYKEEREDELTHDWIADWINDTYCQDCINLYDCNKSRIICKLEDGRDNK